MHIFESLAHVADRLEQHAEELRKRAASVVSAPDAELLKRESAAWGACAQLVRGSKLAAASAEPPSRIGTLTSATVVSRDYSDGETRYSVRCRLKDGSVPGFMLQCANLERAVHVQAAVQYGVVAIGLE